MSGVIGDPLPEQLPFVQQLRENLQDLDLCEEALSDMNLIRWVRARNLNIVEAEKMLRKHLQWYEDEEMATILSYETPKMILENCIIRICGFDNERSPILVADSKEWENVPRVLKCYSKNEVMRHYLQMYEVGCAMSRQQTQIQNKKHFTPTVLIFNMEGLSWKLLTLDCTTLIVTFARALEQNYPETVKIIYIINSPRIFSFVWALLRPILAEKTIAKFRIYGYNREEWSKDILSHTPQNQLSEQYGGILSNDTDISLKIEEVIPRKRGSY